MGRDGVNIKGGSNHGIRSCLLRQLGFSGIQIEGGDRRTLTPAGHFVENSVVETFSTFKRTYEPDPEGGRRLKSEVVTRRTVAPDLDAILFALTNLNPDRWQAKPAPGPAVKNAAGKTSPERNGTNPPRPGGRRSPLRAQP